MVERRAAVVEARSSITLVNCDDRPPWGGGDSRFSAWRACTPESSTAASRPCWRTPLAVKGNAEVGTKAARPIRVDRLAPVAVDDCPTRSARAT